MSPTLEARFVSDKDAARYLGVTDRMVRKLHSQGKLRGYKFGAARRYKLDDLDRYAEAQADQEEAA